MYVCVCVCVFVDVCCVYVSFVYILDGRVFIWDYDSPALHWSESEKNGCLWVYCSVGEVPKVDRKKDLDIVDNVIPKSLHQLVRDCLRVHPNERPEMMDLVNRLQTLLRK